MVRCCLVIVLLCCLASHDAKRRQRHLKKFNHRRNFFAGSKPTTTALSTTKRNQTVGDHLNRKRWLEASYNQPYRTSETGDLGDYETASLFNSRASRRQNFVGTQADDMTYGSDMEAYLKPGIGDYPSDISSEYTKSYDIDGVSNKLQSAKTSLTDEMTSSSLVDSIDTNAMKSRSVDSLSPFADSLLMPDVLTKNSEKVTSKVGESTSSAFMGGEDGGGGASIAADSSNQDEVSPAKVIDSALSKIESEASKLIKESKEMHASGSGEESVTENSKTPKGESLEGVATLKEDSDSKPEATKTVSHPLEPLESREKGAQSSGSGDGGEFERKKVSPQNLHESSLTEGSGDTNDRDQAKDKNHLKLNDRKTKDKEKHVKGTRREEDYSSTISFINPVSSNGNGIGLPVTATNVYLTDEITNAEKAAETPNTGGGAHNLKTNLVYSLKNALFENVKNIMAAEDVALDARTQDEKEAKLTAEVPIKVKEKEPKKIKALSKNKKGKGEEKKKEKEDKLKVYKDEKSVKVNASPEENKESDAGQQHVAGTEDRQPGSDDKSDLLEENLMKIDKPKLVHLLAKFLRDRKKSKDSTEKNGNTQNAPSALTGGGNPFGGMSPMMLKQNNYPSHISTGSGHNMQEFYMNELPGKPVKVDEPTKTGHKVSPTSSHLKENIKDEYDPYVDIGQKDPDDGDKTTRHAVEDEDKEKSKSDQEEAVQVTEVKEEGEENTGKQEKSKEKAESASSKKIEKQKEKSSKQMGAKASTSSVNMAPEEETTTKDDKEPVTSSKNKAHAQKEGNQVMSASLVNEIADDIDKQLIDKIMEKESSHTKKIAEDVDAHLTSEEKVHHQASEKEFETNSKTVAALDGSGDSESSKIESESKSDVKEENDINLQKLIVRIKAQLKANKSKKAQKKYMPSAKPYDAYAEIGSFGKRDSEVSAASKMSNIHRPKHLHMFS